MTKPCCFRVDEEQEKIVKNFKSALIRKYRKLQGVWSNEIVALMDNYLKTGGGQSTHTETPTHFTAFHHRLARIYFALPNRGTFMRGVVDMFIERFAGHHPKTKNQYWNDIRAWGLIELAIVHKDERKTTYRRCPLTKLNEWIREVHELAQGAER